MAELQQSVGVFPAIAAQGDFASENPRATAISNNGGFVAGEDGVGIGTFAWLSQDGRTLNNTGEGSLLGFVSRTANIGFIYQWLKGYSMTIPKGIETTVHKSGDFYAVFTNDAERGQKVFASLVDGSLQAGEAGADIEDHIETKFSVDKGAVTGALVLITTY